MIIDSSVQMIFAVYPVAMAIRATNVYEAKALGIRYDEDNLSTGLRHLRQEEGYVGLHLKEQLSYDVWFIILATFLSQAALLCITARRLMCSACPVCIVERAALETPATSSYGQFSVFDVIFEVCSAYANVGLSIGSPSVSMSLLATGNQLTVACRVTPAQAVTFVTSAN